MPLMHPHSALPLILSLSICSFVPLRAVTDPIATTSDAFLTPACLQDYEEGGAPAVLRSPDCSRPPAVLTALPDGGLHGVTVLDNVCQVAADRGRRRYMEDRPVCGGGKGWGAWLNSSIVVPAVFDGHGGAEASEMASKLLFDYLSIHLRFLLRGSPADVIENPSLQLREALKTAISKTILEIDSDYNQEALEKNLEAGTTAAIAIVANGHVMAANVGDSKVLLCFQDEHLPAEVTEADLRAQRRRKQRDTGGAGRKPIATSPAKYVHVTELTHDHHPDRPEERERVERSGGFVDARYGTPRVNGVLAVSRSIGDVRFKRFGVVATPEISDWQPLIGERIRDGYVMVASDGVFDKMSPQETCELLYDDTATAAGDSLAQHVVRIAYELGSLDNLSAVVVPLRRLSRSPLTPARNHDEL